MQYSNASRMDSLKLLGFKLLIKAKAEINLSRAFAQNFKGEEGRLKIRSHSKRVL